MLRRLMAGLLVLGVLAGVSVPALGQDKGKDKSKDKEKGKGTVEKDKGTAEKGKGISLTWKFEKGQTFYQKLTTKTSQNMKVMNNDVTQTQSQTFYFSWTPEKKDGDKWTLKQKIEGVVMDIDIGGNKIAYDSTKDSAANNPLADYFKALKGSEFTIVLDTKTMKVDKVEGRDDFLRKLIAANPQMKSLLETILSEASLKEMAEPTFAVVPTKAVAKGDKWERKTTLDMGPIGKYENTYGYEYAGAEGDKQKIKVDTNLVYTAPGEAARGGLPFTIKSATLKSKSEAGEIVFDSAKGRLEKSTMKVTLTGDLAIDIGGTPTKVKLNQVQTSEIQSLDKLPFQAAK